MIAFLGALAGVLLALWLNVWLGFNASNHRHWIFAVLSCIAIGMVGCFIGWTISDWRKRREDL